MIYYTSDLHLGHEGAVKHCRRPFSSVKEMDETIINNYNSIVTDKDDVYILGDVIFKSAEEPEKTIRRLKGRKHLIIGNHDERLIKNEAAMREFESADNYLKIHDNKRTVILFHYPIAEWDGFFRGKYHIYGHIHNNTANPAYEIMKSLSGAYNAGVDVNDFMPVTLDMLIARYGDRK